MLKKYTNLKNLPLPLAVWLANDTYDHDPRPNAISVTSLIKSVRSIVLSRRMKPEELTQEDIYDLIASSVGTAIHDSIEQAWKTNFKGSLAALGYPQRVIDKIRINPSEPEEGTIPAYMEERAEKVVGEWVVLGKPDLILESIVQDYKTTTVFTYKSGVKLEAFRKQLSLYKWLEPKKITAEHGKILYVFKDWKAFDVSQQGYPQLPIVEQDISLMSESDSGRYVKNKLDLIATHMETPESELPLCTPEELGQGKPAYKYYANPQKTTKATKVFTDFSAANLHRAKQGKGVVLTVYGDPFECKWCKARPVCSQYANMLAQGIAKKTT